MYMSSGGKWDRRGSKLREISGSEGLLSDGAVSTTLAFSVLPLASFLRMLSRNGACFLSWTEAYEIYKDTWGKRAQKDEG